MTTMSPEAAGSQPEAVSDLDGSGLAVGSLSGQDRIFPSVKRTVAADDGMVNGTDLRHYFSTGASALWCIEQALDAADLGHPQVHRILDYACGYGRVLRWLEAAFPEADILGVDADPRAAAEAHRVLQVETRRLDISLQAPLDAPFDLIWVGSLLTHLPKAECQRVMDYLARHLNPAGVLVVTTHGSLVRNRIASGQRMYGLEASQAETVVRDLDEHGFGFSPYPGLTDYGISVNRVALMMEMLETAGLDPVHYCARGWAQHQDVYAARRAR